MLVFFLVTTLSFLLFLKSLPLHFHKEFSPSSPIPKPIIKKHIFGALSGFISTTNLKMKQGFLSNPELHNPKELKDEQIPTSSLLDLPELALDCILEKLPPSGLSAMAGVCSSLRERCTSQHFWERHLSQKWGTVLSPAAYRDWELFVASRMKNHHVNSARKPQGFVKFFLLQIWPLTWFLSKFDKGHDKVKVQERGSPVHDSVMSLYLALESGKFWFPAQVYNRENGHIGFMLSCYDAKLSYDHHTDTFQAKYPAHGRRAVAMESGVPWERLRAAPVETSPHQLHISDCLNDLHPGDHIEIQWRRNKEFPYGWWYGVVGHLESCDGHENYCRCQASDAVVLEFNHYAPGSRWRSTVVSRKDHRETGNEADGFYGGIRKLYKTDEISTWKRLWPKDILE